MPSWFLLRRLTRRRLEGEQHVAAASVAKAGVTRSDEHHSAGDRHAGRAHRATLRGDAVGRREITNRVELPDLPAVSGRERAQHAVLAAGEHNAWNHRESS